jgi:hypothetical protein
MRDKGKVNRPNQIGIFEDGEIKWVDKPTETVVQLEARVKYLEDEYMHLKKAFADLVPVLDAIIEQQKTLESIVKPLCGPQIIQ